MSEEKKKVDNKRTIDPAALAVLGANEGKIETAYDRYVNMQPQCNFGRTGICCRICLQGPCRITRNLQGNMQGSLITIVAATDRSINGGTSAHADHSKHMLYALKELLEGKPPTMPSRIGKLQ